MEIQEHNREQNKSRNMIKIAKSVCTKAQTIYLWHCNHVHVSISHVHEGCQRLLCLQTEGLC